MHGFKQRISLLGLLAVVFLAAYGTARRYSPALIAYVVEQALLQKTPDGVTPEQARSRFETWLNSANPEGKTMKLLVLSKYLEKVQKLSVIEMDQLLKEEARSQE